MPKYILFYHLNSSNRLELSHFTELKSNGCYEEICFGRISNEFLVLKSKTASMGGRTNHITIIKNFDFDNCFSISTNMFDQDFHDFHDFHEQEKLEHRLKHSLNCRYDEHHDFAQSYHQEDSERERQNES